MKNITTLRQTGPESQYAGMPPKDMLTEVCRWGAVEMLAKVIKDEVETFIASYADLTDESGHRQVVRNGHLPEREIQTGIGQVAVRMPRVRDNSGSGIRFTWGDKPNIHGN